MGSSPRWCVTSCGGGHGGPIQRAPPARERPAVVERERRDDLIAAAVEREEPPLLEPALLDAHAVGLLRPTRDLQPRVEEVRPKVRRAPRARRLDAQQRGGGDGGLLGGARPVLAPVRAATPLVIPAGAVAGGDEPGSAGRTLSVADHPTLELEA